ncbi:MAG TPA: sulfotransferase [Parvularcula sp.]|nr:sulfotransferase [Parvularcula sp.]HBS30163.1 sulfotransferase [Parvularcula sp.]HBS34654.1 sulfotransferase [Parvularcula sp.]
MTSKRKPHFIIIGAVKGATTWSARALARHPSVFIPGPEPHYFSSEYANGPAWYLDLFAGADETAVIGEKSADYLAHPEAAARMAEFVPDARLIVQLRNPVERAYSDYCMLYRRGTVRDRPAAYFSPKRAGAERERFLTGGLYADHLRRFYDRFSREQMLVLLVDEITASPTPAFNRILSHIGLPAEATEVATERENDSTAPLLPLGLRSALKPFKNAVRPLRGNKIFESVRGVFAREVAYPPLDHQTRMFLADFYSRDIALLERTISRNLDAWRRPPSPAASPQLHPVRL